MTLSGTAQAQAGDSAPSAVQETSEFRKALGGGRIWIDLRYRLENLDQDGFAKEATASTLRTALGYETAQFEGFRALIEFEDVAPIGNDKLYNSTTNGVGGLRPTIPDTDGTEVNQLYVTYEADGDLRARFGRQEFFYNDGRFIGDRAWRQNHQSYDALRLTHTGLRKTTIDYAFLHAVNTPNGENHPLGEERMRTHLLDIRHELEGIGELGAYGYLIDFDERVNFSTRTLGVRFQGQRALDDRFDVLYRGEYADQQDYGKNPTVGGIDADYHLVELGVAFGGFTLQVANEHLGGSGAPGDKFTTPLGRFHPFNGLTDLFATVPDTGLEDRWISLSKQLFGVDCMASYHEFEADTGGLDYGTEFDLAATYAISKRLTVGAQFGNFNRDGNAPAPFSDTARLISWISYSLL